MLQALNLLDDELHWKGEQTHLVFVGDILDRGPDDIKLLELVRRLQGEAQARNGKVHMLLGNHEAMNLAQDFRYVSEKGYEYFCDEEDPGTRNRMRKRFMRANRPGVCDDSLGSEECERKFHELYPHGFFGRADALGPDGRYGAWLMDQDAIIRINGFIFVHAGLVEDVAMLGYKRINRSLITSIRSYWEARGALESLGVIAPYSSFREVLVAADAVVTGRVNGKKKVAAEAVVDFARSLPVSVDGPLWYRGTSKEDERLERTRVFSSLEWLDGKAMVLGHSITESGNISSRFGGRVIRADVGLQSRGNRRALVISGEKISMFNPESGEYLQVEAEPLWGEANLHPASRIQPADLEEILIKSELEAVRPLRKDKSRPLLVSFRKQGVRVRGVFKDVKTRDGERYQHEIAAYLVDRVLGLGLVPVTVPRTLPREGQGSLQYFVDGALDRKLSQTYGLPMKFQMIVAPQREDAEVFDALIGNVRSEDNILNLPEEERIVLIDHAAGFSTESGIEPYFPKGECLLAPIMRSKLESLDMKRLESLLGEWIRKRQFKALVARRDALLAQCQAGS